MMVGCSPGPTAADGDTMCFYPHDILTKSDLSLGIIHEQYQFPWSWKADFLIGPAGCSQFRQESIHSCHLMLWRLGTGPQTQFYLHTGMCPSLPPGTRLLTSARIASQLHRAAAIYEDK